MNSPAEPPEGVSTSDVPDRPGLVRRLYDQITDKVAVKHPWYRWIADNTMRSVLARHCPDLEPTVAKLPNAFGIWDRTAPK